MPHAGLVGLGVARLVAVHAEVPRLVLRLEQRQPLRLRLRAARGITASSLHCHCKRNQACKPKAYEAKVRVGVLGLGLGLGLGFRVGLGLDSGPGPGLCLPERLLLGHIRLLGREGSGGAATPGAVRRRLGRARELAPRAITLGTVHPPRFGRYRGYRERASGLRADATGGWQAADQVSFLKVVY